LPPRYLDLGDFLMIAAAIVGGEAEDVAATAQLDRVQAALLTPLAEADGVERYTSIATKAGVLAARIVGSRPLPEANAQVAWVCLCEFVLRNGHDWYGTDVDEAVEKFMALSSGELSEEEFVGWVAARVRERKADAA
jgi:prophage maintenance system killer protein